MEADERTSKEIARLGGFSAPSLTVWSNGPTVPGADQLASLARVFNVPLDYFFEGKDSPQPTPLRETPGEALVDDALQEMDNLKEQVATLDRAMQRLKIKTAFTPAANLTPDAAAKAGAKQAVAGVEQPGVVYGRSRKAPSTTGKIS